MTQWLRLCTSNAGGADSTPGQGTEIPHAARKERNRCRTPQFDMMLSFGTVKEGDKTHLGNPVLPSGARCGDHCRPDSRSFLFRVWPGEGAQEPD